MKQGKSLLQNINPYIIVPQEGVSITGTIGSRENGRTFEIKTEIAEIRRGRGLAAPRELDPKLQNQQI